MITLFLSINAILLLFMGNFLYTQRQHSKALEGRMDDLAKACEQITKDHPMLIHADLLFSKQMKDINAQLISMDNQLQDMENKRDNDGGYQHALRILEMGGDRDEIVNSCNLSNAEAELLINLQAYRAAMPAV